MTSGDDSRGRSTALFPGRPTRTGNTEITSFGKPIPEADEPEPPRQQAQVPEPNAEPAQTHHESDYERPKLEKEWLKSTLWSAVRNNPDLKVYALLDGGWCPGLYGRLLASNLPYCNLFQGPSVVEYPLDSPYLVALERDHPLTDWLFDEGWGKGWGVYVVASSAKAREMYKAPLVPLLSQLRSRGHFIATQGIEASEDDPLLLLRQHFRRFSRVEFEDDGRVILFRYYDPDVLGNYIRSCNPQELAAFFGPIKLFFAESYNEVESLNAPYAACAYYGPMENVRMKNLRYDGFRQAYEELSVSPSATIQAERQSGLYTLIRTEQRHYFQKKELEKEVERIAGMLSDIGMAHGRRPHLQSLRAFSAAQVEKAKAAGLTSSAAWHAYAKCALVIGENFATNHLDAEKIFYDCRGEEEPDTSDKLDALATSWLLERGLQ